ncbi:MAG: porin [Myxococcota bacterium]|nr:porin [Myxococcota bacterium]
MTSTPTASLGLAALGLVLGLALASPSAYATEKKSVTEEILEILKASGTISDAKYNELLERAEAEESAREEAAQAAAAPAEIPTDSSAKDDPTGWTVKWSNGTKIERNDGEYKLKFGGRVMLDMAQIWADRNLRQTLATTNRDDNGTGFGVEIRRARIFAQGTLYKRFFFKASYEFGGTRNGGNAVEPKDIYMGMKKVGPLGTVRIGHMKEDFSLEEMTSSKYLVFMERGLPAVFNPVRNWGINAYNTFLDGRLRYALGGYRQTNESGFGFGGSNTTSYHITGRLTGLPYWEDGGKKLIHLGLNYSHQFTSSGGATGLGYGERPEAHLALRYVNTGRLSAVPVDAVDLFTTEFAANWNSLAFQSEWQAALLDRRGADDVLLWGIYGQAGWFITGEHRNYSQKYANFGRTQLNSTFDPRAGTWGAFEIAARVSYLDLNDHDIRGGRLFDVTAGVNWYLWPNVRIMANYIHSILMGRAAGASPGKGDGDLFQMRLQLDF